jgi:hypothetical protein
MAKGKKTGGRTKGVPNKLTGDVKAMILQALDDAGGKDYLLAQSETNPVAFLGLVGKVLPMTVTSDPDNPIKTVLEITWGGMSASSAGKS